MPRLYFERGYINHVGTPFVFARYGEKPAAPISSGELRDFGAFLEISRERSADIEKVFQCEGDKERIETAELKEINERYAEYFTSLDSNKPVEWLVPSATLVGLMPFALLEGYRFWRTGPTSIRGYPSPPSRLTFRRKFEGGREALIDRLRSMRWWGGTYILIELVGGGEVSISRRAFPTEVEIAENALSMYDEKSQEMSKEELAKAFVPISTLPPGEQTLLNLHGGHKLDDDLQRLVNVLTRLERSLGNILIWLRGDPERTVEKDAEIVDIHLPRLQLHFITKEVYKEDGKPQWRCYVTGQDGLYILNDDKVASKLTNGLPNSIALTNDVGNRYVLTPSYGMARTKVKNLPLNTVDYPQSEADLPWSGTVSLPYFIYEVHPTGEDLLPQSVAAALYLVYARLVKRDYAGAANCIPACEKNVPYDEEEKWMFSQISGMFEIKDSYDTHPDSIAIRCRLTLIAYNAEGNKGSKIIDWNPNEDAVLYRHQSKSIDAACRLTKSEFQSFLVYIGDVDEDEDAVEEENTDDKESQNSVNSKADMGLGSRTSEKNDHHCGSVLADGSDTDIAKEVRRR